MHIADRVNDCWSSNFLADGISSTIIFTRENVLFLIERKPHISVYNIFNVEFHCDGP